LNKNIPISANGSYGSTIAVNPTTNKIYITNNEDWSLTVVNGSNDNVLNNGTINPNKIRLDISPEFIVVDPAINMIYVTSYHNLEVTKGEEDKFNPRTALVRQPVAQIEFINGSNDKNPLGRVQLDTKYGSLIPTLNPNNHDLLAISPSTDMILINKFSHKGKSLALLINSGILVEIGMLTF
jgi:hypothetical protein